MLDYVVIFVVLVAIVVLDGVWFALLRAAWFSNSVFWWLAIITTIVPLAVLLVAYIVNLRSALEDDKGKVHFFTKAEGRKKMFNELMYSPSTGFFLGDVELEKTFFDEQNSIGLFFAVVRGKYENVRYYFVVVLNKPGRDTRFEEFEESMRSSWEKRTLFDPLAKFDVDEMITRLGFPGERFSATIVKHTDALGEVTEKIEKKPIDVDDGSEFLAGRSGDEGVDVK